MVLEQATKSSEYSHAFLQATAEEFSYYKSFAERAIAQISDEQLHTPLDANTNSVIVIMKHLAGNMMSRWTEFLTTDWEKPTRDRDGEFIDDIATRAEIITRWEAGWGLVFSTLSGLRPDDLEKTVYVRSEPMSVLIHAPPSSELRHMIPLSVNDLVPLFGSRTMWLVHAVAECQLLRK